MQRRECRVIAWLATMLVFAVACTSSMSASAGIAAYAEGQWTCVMTALPPTPAPVSIAANVTVRDESSGRVELGLPSGTGDSRTVSGTWRLADDRLTVRWDRDDMRRDDNVGPTHGRGLALDADRIEIRGETIRPRRAGNWVPVTVDRRARSVTFRFAVGDGDRARLRCGKV